MEALESASDIVVASRFCVGGDSALGRLRSALSRASSRAAMLLFPTRLWHVTDPMSGCFLVRRDVVDLDSLRPRGFKILLEILVRTPGLTSFGGAGRVRRAARGSHQGLDARGAALPETAWPAPVRPAGGPLRPLRPLRRGGRDRTGREHPAARRCSWTSPGIYYVGAAILATQGSTLWNFCLTERWVFGGPRPRAHPGAPRRDVLRNEQPRTGCCGCRCCSCSPASSGSTTWCPTSSRWWALTVIRFVVADGWIWAKAQRREVASFSYDIHGIVTVTSEVRLPELQRFMVTEALGRPTIRVRIGHMRAAAAAGRNGTVHLNGNSPHDLNGASHATNGNGNGHTPDGHGTSPLSSWASPNSRRGTATATARAASGTPKASGPSASGLRSPRWESASRYWPLRCSSARPMCSTPTWSSPSCAGRSRARATRWCTPPASRTATRGSC